MRLVVNADSGTGKAAMAQQDRINNRFSKALLARHRPR